MGPCQDKSLGHPCLSHGLMQQEALLYLALGPSGPRTEKKTSVPCTAPSQLKFFCIHSVSITGGPPSFENIDFFSRDHIHLTFTMAYCYGCSILLPVMVTNLLLCLLYELNLITEMYVWENHSIEDAVHPGMTRSPEGTSYIKGGRRFC